MKNNILGAFSINVLEDLKTAIIHAANKGFPPEKLLGLIEEQLEIERNRFSKDHEVLVNRGGGIRKCPSCGISMLIPVVTKDATIKIIGCKRCRYSMIKG